MMVAAFAEAARNADLILHTLKYLDVATRSAEFLLTALRPDGLLRRSWRSGQATTEVFLEDYASLILGLLELYQTDFNNQWFVSARELADEMIQRFSDPSGGFFDTPDRSEALLIRPKDVQDNATPSGNALACEALLKLAAFADHGEYRDLAEKSLSQVVGMSMRYPTAFARWLSAATNAVHSGRQVAVLGDAQDEHFKQMIQLVRSDYRPGLVVAASPHPIQKDAPSLLADRPLLDGKATAYVCEGFVCKRPTTSVDDLQAQLAE
jgi:uncharacterized protein YyaL (SSP411 family)